MNATPPSTPPPAHTPSPPSAGSAAAAAAAPDVLVLPELFTAPDGTAAWREQRFALDGGSPASRLSALHAGAGLQLRRSPVGFRSDWHCTGTPQWLFVLSGIMEIGLRDGSVRRFGPGMGFLSNDTLPAGASFDAGVHGHWSRQAGAEPLETLFVRIAPGG